MERATNNKPSHTSVLLYDGDCGFCAKSVQFVLAHEQVSHPGAIRFAPLQGTFGASVRNTHPFLNNIDSVVWFDPTRSDPDAVRVKSDAALSVLTYLGGTWRAFAFLARLVPRAVRDFVYDAIAKRRMDIVAPACLLPSVEIRTRFLA